VSPDQAANPAGRPDPDNLSCDCRDWTLNRALFPARDPRRLCAHLVRALLDSPDGLPEKLAPRARQLELVRGLGLGFPICRRITPLKARGMTADVFFPLDRGQSRMIVLTPERAYVYDAAERIWEGEAKPACAPAVEKRVHAVLAEEEERGRDKAEERTNQAKEKQVPEEVAALADFFTPAQKTPVPEADPAEKAKPERAFPRLDPKAQKLSAPDRPKLLTRSRILALILGCVSLGLLYLIVFQLDEPKPEIPAAPPQKPGQVKAADPQTAAQARSLLEFIEANPGRGRYTITKRTEQGVVVLGCDFDREVLSRVLQKADGSQIQEVWRGFIMERLQGATSGKSLDHTPEGLKPAVKPNKP